ncbi:hypothetical protein ACFL4A_04960, partial [bacterium]
MLQFIKNNWEFLSVLIGFIIGVCKYFHVRTKELAWLRTKFIFEQARLFDTDLDMVEAVQIIEGRHKEI